MTKEVKELKSCEILSQYHHSFTFTDSMNMMLILLKDGGITITVWWAKLDVECFVQSFSLQLGIEMKKKHYVYFCESRVLIVLEQ